jgi:hypothetical protein
MVAVVAACAPIGPSPGLRASIAAATPSNDPSATTSGEPSPASTPSPALESTPDPMPSLAPPAFTWQRHVLPGLAYGSVTSYGDGFIALGPAEGDDREMVSILRSEDGLTWRTFARRPFGGQIPQSMTLVDGRLIVIAWRVLGPESAEPVVWTSTDGKAWDIWFEPEGLPVSVSVARVGGRWLLGSGWGAGIQCSSDGKHWTTALPLHPAAEGAGLAVGPGGVLAPVTQEGENGPGRSWMYLSKDGMEWTESAFEDAADTRIWRAAANHEGYVAIGWGSYQTAPSVGRAWWSADGTTWQRSVVPDDFGASLFHPKEIIRYGTGFLATLTPREEGPDRMLWTSDGREWQYIEGGPDVLYEGTGLVTDDRRVLWFGYELTDTEVRTLWEATPVD